MRKHLGHLIRVLFGLGLLAFLLLRMDLREILRLLASLHPLYFALAVLVYGLVLFLFALRWKLFMAAQEIPAPLPSLLKVYTLGIFLGNFMPAGAGVDLVRAYYLARFAGKTASSLATVLVDRLIGFLAIALMALAGVLFGVSGVREHWKTVLFVVAAVVLSTLAPLSRRSRPVAEWVRDRLRLLRLGERLFALYEAFALYRDHLEAILLGLVLSILLQLVTILSAYFCALALGLSLPFLKLLIVIPAANFIAAIPVSVGGLGVREGTFVVLLSGMASPEEALTLSVLFYLTSTVASLPGFLFLILGKAEIPKEEPV